MRTLALAIAILLAACAPCQLYCTNDLECPQGYYCLDNSACLPDCFRCNGQCAETFSNCGACGVSCSQGQVCLLGSLSAGASCAANCAPGTTPCNGSCYNLTTDSFHCGSCTKACARDEICKNGNNGPVCTKVDVCQ